MVRPDFLMKSGSPSSVSPEGARPGSGSDPLPPVFPSAKEPLEGSPTPGRGMAAGTSPEAAPAVLRSKASQASPPAPDGVGLRALSSSVLGMEPGAPPLTGLGCSFSLERTRWSRSAQPPPPPLAGPPLPASAGGGGTGLAPPKEMGAVFVAGLARSSAAARRAPKLSPPSEGGGGGGGGEGGGGGGGGGGDQPGGLEIAPEIRWFVPSGGISGYYTVYGGTPPYTWRVSDSALGTLSPTTGTRVTYTTTRIPGTNIITVTDGNHDTATAWAEYH